MSSANLPRPRNRRSSSLRGSEAPTQGPLPFFFSSSVTIFSASANISRTGVSAPHELCQRRLQSVDQFLNLFLAQRFEQTTGDRCLPSENLGFSLPVHFCCACGSIRGRCQVKPGNDRDVSSGDGSLSFILSAARAIRFRQFHLHVCAALDVGDAHVQLDGEM